MTADCPAQNEVRPLDIREISFERRNLEGVSGRKNQAKTIHDLPNVVRRQRGQSTQSTRLTVDLTLYGSVLPSNFSSFPSADPKVLFPLKAPIDLCRATFVEAPRLLYA